jgi:hypothetical protein
VITAIQISVLRGEECAANKPQMAKNASNSHFQTILIY